MRNPNSTSITQGEFAIGMTEEVLITTILGSCVAACMWDPIAGIGGMNHILLPDGARGMGNVQGYGVNAMELLINSIVKEGGQKFRLEAKLFGGGKMISGLSDVGLRNGEFALSFLEAEGILCQSHSLGGEQARRIQFWPHSGRARQKYLGRMELAEKPITAPQSDIELF